MELKTLKEFTNLDGKCFCEDGHSHVPDKLLKQEAIRWIKEFNKELGSHRISKDHCGGACDDAGFCVEDISPKIEWIKHFFNITEEDLKVSEGQNGENKLGK